jgi:hypothetical protein
MVRLYLGSVKKKSKVRRLMKEENNEGPVPKRRALAIVAIK